MPASAKGVLFVTIEDETGAANLVIWPDLFERQRRVVLGAHLVAVKGRIQREGEVVHLIAERLDDLADDLASIGNREAPFVLPAGRGDEVRRASTPDPRERPAVWPRDMFSPDLSLEAIRLKSRDFR
jgi:error-prone DNA polymerase